MCVCLCVNVCVCMLIWWAGWFLVVFFCPEICSLQPSPQLHCVKACIKYILKFQFTNVIWKLERWLGSYERLLLFQRSRVGPIPVSSRSRQTPVLWQSLLRSMATWNALTYTDSHKDMHTHVIENKICLWKMLCKSLKWAGGVRVLLDSLNSLVLGQPILFSVQCR